MHYLGVVISFAASMAALAHAGPIGREPHRQFPRAGSLYGNSTLYVAPSAQLTSAAPDTTCTKKTQPTTTLEAKHEDSQLPETSSTPRRRIRTTTVVLTKDQTQTQYAPPNPATQPPSKPAYQTAAPSTECLSFAGGKGCIPQRTNSDTQGPQPTTTENLSPTTSETGDSPSQTITTEAPSAPEDSSVGPTSTEQDVGTTSLSSPQPPQSTEEPEQTTQPGHQYPGASKTPKELTTTEPVQQPTPTIPISTPSETSRPLPSNPSDPANPGSTPYPEFASNIPTAIKKNHEFLSFNVGDKCNPNEPLEGIACAQGQRVTCDPKTGTYQNPVKCEVNTKCFAVPLQTCKGFAVACLSPQDTAERCGMTVPELNKAITDGDIPGNGPSKYSSVVIPTPTETPALSTTISPQQTAPSQCPDQAKETVTIVSTVTAKAY